MAGTEKPISRMVDFYRAQTFPFTILREVGHLRSLKVRDVRVYSEKEGFRSYICEDQRERYPFKVLPDRQNPRLEGLKGDISLVSVEPLTNPFACLKLIVDICGIAGPDIFKPETHTILGISARKNLEPS